MKKQGTKVLLASIMVSVMFLGAVPARAATNADLLAQIESLLKVIAQLQAQLGSTQGGQATSCVALTRTLYVGLSDGETGGEVTKLQRFLGMSPTGFFGPMTEGKVRAWQAQKGIVSSGDADTTGYGLVGVRTRALMNQCGGTTNLPKPDVAVDRKAPSCKIWTSNANPQVGERFTISWSTRNMVDPAFDEGLKAGGQYTVEKNGSRTFKELSAYTGQFSISPDLGTYAPLCSVSVNIGYGGESEDISGRLTHIKLSYSENPLIKGSALGVSNVGFSLSGMSGDKVYGSGPIPVVDGKWSQKVSIDLTPGQYGITLSDYPKSQVLDTSKIEILAFPNITAFSLQSFNGNAGGGQNGTFVWESDNAEWCGIYKKTSNDGLEVIKHGLEPSGYLTTEIVHTTSGPLLYELVCAGRVTGDGKDGPSDSTTIEVPYKG